MFVRDEKRDAFFGLPSVLKFAPGSQKSTCRAFRRIFGRFSVNRVAMSCLMPLYTFQKGNIHACNARQPRNANRKVHVIWPQQ